MRNRLLLVSAGAVLGLVVAMPISSALQISATLAFVACSIVGCILGWMGGLLMDVFMSSPTDN